ncbi:unnamed protein product [marine sediment metagenome]|uniref:Uncharacterized protein n=1 Tax=marine sediment metagenome TaxID=412755 RepID=X1HYP7_9ZZZZ
MSDVQTIGDCITEYRKANKALDDKLKEIEEHHQQTLRESADKQTHPG